MGQPVGPTRLLLLLTGILIVGTFHVRFRAVETVGTPFQEQTLPQDAGAAGVWQKIRKLQTTASVLHTTAHPDDEHGGLLALLSRGQGVRTAMLTLNRGEAGDNAIGPELFDPLGLIRTEELGLAGRFYGLDAQYFTTVADYGFSKRLDEALDKWGHDAVLSDVVRVIRTERPWVIVSRFQGTARDGHGQHMAAGLLTQEAFHAAADPKRFPDQIAEGLRPWQALKLYMGGARETEDWTVEVDPGAYDPVLGDSYQALARRGLALQRSQNGGRVLAQPGSAMAYYVRLWPGGALAKPGEPSTRAVPGGLGAVPTDGRGRPGGSTLPTAAASAATGNARPVAFVDAPEPTGVSNTMGLAPAPAMNGGGGAPPVPPAREAGFFDGIDITLPGVYRTLGVTEPPAANALLVAIDQHVQQAVAAFTLTNPAAAAPALARGLTATRAALAKLGTDADVADILKIKERQFIDALTASLGLSLTGIAVPPSPPAAAGTDGAAASPFTPPAVLGPIVPGQTIGVHATLVVRGAAPITLRALDLVAPAGWTGKGGNPGLASRPVPNRPVMQRFEVTVPNGALPSRSPLYRESPEVPRYKAEGPDRYRPSPAPSLFVQATYEYEGTIVDISEPVRRRESRAPYGFVTRELTILPPLAITVSPEQAIVPANAARKPITLTVDVTNNQPRDASGTVVITLPQDWRADPASQPFRLAAGERGQVTFSVSTPTVKPRAYRIDVAALSDGHSFAEGYDVIEHRDLETRYAYRPSTATITMMNVDIAPNLRVGYVMGIGDALPAAIAQLGATVEMLDPAALTAAAQKSGGLERFDAIVLGTRAYAVRPDVHAANARLLDYVKNGGNLIVLYNTPELDPATQAPFPGKLTADAEEVSEEDATVTILAPQHQVMSRPNKIAASDFNGWMEQRGSKFWREWDAAYTPLLECHDQGQAPQRGGWLYARVGKGHYSYVGYALHRQTPFGVPGAYRLLANLLSLGKS